MNSPEHLTDHARSRMAQRGISMAEIQFALDFGHMVETPDAIIYFVGRRDLRRVGVMSRSPYEGVHVVCSQMGSIITVYRDRKLPRLRRHRRHHNGYPKAQHSERRAA